MVWASKILLFLSLMLLTACVSVKSVGKLGPKQLDVYAVSHSDFLSASRMLIILNEKGDVVAYSGGTVAGGGTIGVQAGSSLVTAGALAYGANAVKNGLESASVNIKGIPSNVNIHTSSDININ